MAGILELTIGLAFEPFDCVIHTPTGTVCWVFGGAEIEGQMKLIVAAMCPIGGGPGLASNWATWKRTPTVDLRISGPLSSADFTLSATPFPLPA